MTHNYTQLLRAGKPTTEFKLGHLESRTKTFIVGIEVLKLIMIISCAKN